jgi:glyoxylase-like metal-dependent hydrolase (beta-lactamase superfamily II)
MYLQKTLMLTTYFSGLTMNCFLFFCPETRKGILIDPGDDAPGLIKWAEANDVELERIVLTHGHIDHIGAVPDLRSTYGLALSIHQDDLTMLANPTLNVSVFAAKTLSLDTADVNILAHGDVIRVGNVTAEVLHTPGHTPGGICLKTADGVFSGDTLFKGSVGRTDFPGGSMKSLVTGIQAQLMTLPDSTAVFPGHEETTTIGYERAHNFMIGA